MQILNRGIVTDTMSAMSPEPGPRNDFRAGQGDMLVSGEWEEGR